MKSQLKLIATFFTVALIVASCSQEEDALSVSEFDAQEELAAIEQEIFTVETWEDGEDELEFGRVIVETYLETPGCVDKTWARDSVNRTRTLTIDFGNVPCLGMDGLYRKGMIVITYTGPRQHPGSSRHTEFFGYFVMNHEYNGTKYVEYQENHTYTRDVDMSLTIGNSIALWQAEQVVEKIAGYLTPERNDDIYQVTGGGQGVRRNGMSYVATITEPLLRKIQPGCFENFVDGVMTFVNEEEVTTLLDYDPIGGAPCDKLASITRNGHTHFITLW
ncbi:MAG: hypothetical protein GY751_18955 [Bacteroidetes bacterium]|nr:hypothetical protein [Bacteroidota bacterium]